MNTNKLREIGAYLFFIIFYDIIYIENKKYMKKEIIKYETLD